MPLKIIQHASSDYAKMLALRNDILRKPLGLVLSSDDIKDEQFDILIAAFDDDEMLGCCVLKKLKGIVILRQMAVKSHLQGKGIGSSIINFAENIIRDHGYMEMKMDARSYAVNFFENQGYSVVGKEFTKLGIPHIEMRKMIL